MDWQLMVDPASRPSHPGQAPAPPVTPERTQRQKKDGWVDGGMDGTTVYCPEVGGQHHTLAEGLTVHPNHMCFRTLLMLMLMR